MFQPHCSVCEILVPRSGIKPVPPAVETWTLNHSTTREVPHKLFLAAAAAAKSLQSCPTLCDPIDGSPPGSSIHGIFQARALEWGAIAFSNKLSVKEQQKGSESRSVMSDSLQPRGLYSPWNSPGQNTTVGSLSLLQGIFPTQGSNPGLPQ